MYLGDTEVWRTSTAEPKAAPGIIWTYWKDVTNYLALWKQPQTLIFDLGNLVNDMYTGAYNTTLTATFFYADLHNTNAPPADAIMPLSAQKGSQGLGSAFTFPQTNATTNITIPRNTQRAVFSIAATGQIGEEFWWTNVPQSLVYTFNDTVGPLPGLSSFREVRLLIDGNVAGLAWPFPVIFTGGISPPLHRPLVGLQTFDLRESEVDVTPWLGYLCDGKDHTYELVVVGIDDSGNEAKLATAPTYWVLTGKLFLWLDADEKSVTTGDYPVVQVSPLYFHTSYDLPTTANFGTLEYKQKVRREISVKSHIKSQKTTHDVSWLQAFKMSNAGILSNDTNYQHVKASYGGQDSASSGGTPYYHSEYLYPVISKSTYKMPDGPYNFTLDADLYQGLELTINGLSAFPNGLEPYLWTLPSTEDSPGSDLSTYRRGSAFYYQQGNQSGGYGYMDQDYRLGTRKEGHWTGINFKDTAQLLFRRSVKVANETVLEDREFSRGSGQPTVSRGDVLGPNLETLQREGMSEFAEVRSYRTREKGWKAYGVEGEVLGTEATTHDLKDEQEAGEDGARFVWKVKDPVDDAADRKEASSGD